MKDRLKNINLHDHTITNAIVKFIKKHVPTSSCLIVPINEIALAQIKRESNQYQIICRAYEKLVYIVFIKICQVFYSITIPQHVIAKLNSNTNANSSPLLPITMTPLVIKAHPQLYAGTIMLASHATIDNTKYYNIEHVYVAMGSKPPNHTLSNHSQYIADLINDQTKIARDPLIVFAPFACCPIQLEALEQLKNEIVNKNSTYSLLFHSTSATSQDIQYEYVIQRHDKIDNMDKYIIAKMSTTNNSNKLSDVYKLSDINSDYKQYGIAYIPSIKSSKECSSWFVNDDYKCTSADGCSYVLAKCELTVQGYQPISPMNINHIKMVEREMMKKNKMINRQMHAK